MRRVLHAHYARLFAPGMRVLDVGCGTGIDTLALARRGVQVVAIDFSEAMIAQLRAKLDGNTSVDARVLAIQELHKLRGERFDGVISGFAGLSTVDDLRGFALDAAELTRPGGRLVLHLLNRFSLWEWLGYVARRDWPAARQVGRRRSRAFTIGGRAVPHRLYFAADLYADVFAGRFALHDAYALGSVRPPHTVRRLPASLVQSLEWLDARAGRWPLLRDAGRFFVLDLERLPT
jgi:SAM-dependent methyltransferase